MLSNCFELLYLCVSLANCNCFSTSEVLELWKQKMKCTQFSLNCHMHPIIYVYLYMFIHQLYSNLTYHIQLLLITNITNICFMFTWHKIHANFCVFVTCSMEFCPPRDGYIHIFCERENQVVLCYCEPLIGP